MARLKQTGLHQDLGGGKVRYESWSPNKATNALCHFAEKKIEKYLAMGYTLSVRQVYYQLVAANLIDNDEKSYKRVCTMLLNARMAGRIAWTAIEDRGRNLNELAWWTSENAMLESCSTSYRIDRWDYQRSRPEVWVEKDALIGVLGKVCREFQVPFISCRGYTSGSEAWAAAQRFRKHSDGYQENVVLYFGDHDPSGVNMTDDIRERLGTFGAEVDVRRMALTWEQIEKYDPPAQAVKKGDSRTAAYVKKYGTLCYELDALDPEVLGDLVRREVKSLINGASWSMAGDEEDKGRAGFAQLSAQYTDSLLCLAAREEHLGVAA